MTKCGRYGSTPSEFDYSPATIRKSVERSLKRLNTTYLDTVYLHDIEFVCTSVSPRKSGNHILAVTDEKEAYGLAPGQENKIWGDGDQKVLDAFDELKKMKDEGLIKHIGITGLFRFPLSQLLADLIISIPTSDFVKGGSLDIAFAAVYSRGRDSLILALVNPKRHTYNVPPPFHRAGHGGPVAHSFSAEYGSAYAQTACVASGNRCR